jgi:hypothetical protein
MVWLCIDTLARQKPFQNDINARGFNGYFQNTGRGDMLVPTCLPWRTPRKGSVRPRNCFRTSADKLEPMRQVAVSRGQRHQLHVSEDQQRLPAFTVRGTPRAHILIVAGPG